MTVTSVLAFAFLPAQRRDIDHIRRPWRHFVFSVAAMMKAVGLLLHDDPALSVDAPGQGGLHAAAARGTGRWLRTWVRDGTGRGKQGGSESADAPSSGLRTPVLIEGGAMLALIWLAIAGMWLGTCHIALSILVSTAQAAVSWSASGDVAQSIFKELFPFLGNGASLLADAIGSTLQVLSGVALILVGIAGLWGCFVMLVDAGWWGNLKQAGHNPWWFGIRFLVSLALLAPVSGSGYGAGQQLLVYAAQWGSDKATSAWTAVIGKMGTVSATAPPMPMVETVVRGVWLQEVCLAAINEQPGRGSIVRGERVEANGVVSYDRVQLDGGRNGLSREKNLCGRTTLRPAAQYDSRSLTKISEAHRTAYSQMRGYIQTAATTYVQQVYSCINASGTCTGTSATAALQAVMLDYIYTLRTGLDAAVKDETSAITRAVKAEGGGGWVLAGTWANKLALANAAVAVSAGQIPEVAFPNVDARRLPQVTEILGTAAQQWTATAQAYPNAFPVAAALSGDDPLGGLFGSLTKGVLGLFTVSGVSALSDMSMIGQGLITVAFTLLAVAAGGSVVGKIIDKFVPVGGVGTGILMNLTPVGLGLTAASEILQGLAPTISGVAWLFLVAGGALAYLVPALPALRYLFAVIGWMISLLQAAILVPLMLVTMVSTEGSGVFNQTSRSALWLCIALVFQPLLTLLGFLAGLALVSPTVGAINSLYLPMMQDAAIAGASGLVGAVVWSLIYVATCWAVVNSLFKLSESLPHAALRWAGQNGAGERDDVGMVIAPIGNFANRMGQSVDRMGGRGRRGGEHRRPEGR